jgi:glycosyltransferase involved in cell wall biosynthesis
MVTPGFYPIRGGAETMVRSLSIELNRIGVQTHVMAFNMDKKWKPKWRGKMEQVDEVKVFKVPAVKLLPSSPRINMNVNLIPGNFTNLMKRYDVIHFHEAELSFPLFSFFVKKPKLLHLHGIHVDYIKRYHLHRLIFKHISNYYIAITREMEKDLIALGIAKSRIIYLPNALDIKLFHPSRNKKEDDLLLYLGRITPVKGLHVLLQSLHYLQKPIRLVIIGPADHSSKYYNDIVNLIEKENKIGRHKVEYLGVVPLEEAIEFYQKATIFILPSFWEAFPVVLLEALSCETPVITTPVGGNPEVIRNFENGVLVPVNNPLKLAEAVNFMLDNKDNITKMGRKGRELVTKNFSVEVIAKRLRKIYEEILSQ